MNALLLNDLSQSKSILQLSINGYIEALFSYDGNNKYQKFYGCDDNILLLESLEKLVEKRLRNFLKDNTESLKFFLIKYSYRFIGMALYLTEMNYGNGFSQLGLGQHGEKLAKSSENGNLAKRLYVNDLNMIVDK
tara:strand:- start:8469 stop:8873 length:405 start_codon:yes stop_codon:yes gene_type:complete